MRKSTYDLVKARFVSKGTTLTRHCRENDIHLQNAIKALSGEWKGEKASRLKSQIIQASKEKRVKP